MGFGASIFLIATGAVLRYGLTRSTWEQFDLDAIGMIAMVVGVLGLIVSTIIWAPWRSRRVLLEEQVVDNPHLHVHP